MHSMDEHMNMDRSVHNEVILNLIITVSSIQY